MVAVLYLGDSIVAFIIPDNQVSHSPLSIARLDGTVTAVIKGQVSLYTTQLKNTCLLETFYLL